jgi:hypothetical protein
MILIKKSNGVCLNVSLKRIIASLHEKHRRRISLCARVCDDEVVSARSSMRCETRQQPRGEIRDNKMFCVFCGLSYRIVVRVLYVLWPLGQSTPSEMYWGTLNERVRRVW